jgi:hypothetical protein
MNTFLILAAALAVLSGPALSDDCAPKSDSSQQSKTAKKETPFACNRKALDPEARKRHFDELGPALREMIKNVRELPNGYEFELPADPKSVQLVAEWAAGERQCCPFFDITMRLTAEDGPMWLRLTGRKGTKQFIEVDGAKWIAKK